MWQALIGVETMKEIPVHLPRHYEIKIGASYTDIRLSAEVEITGDMKVLPNG